MGKRIGRIYKYDHQKCPYLSPNTTLFILPCFYTYIQTQRNSAADASVGANDEPSTVLYQSNKHHYNKNVEDNYDS